ncbi:hypothetical protein KY285_024585 [Solanum tuberosum]|nr:hypothetical protein KY285_024585 [Solanum tuberosum]
MGSKRALMPRLCFESISHAHQLFRKRRTPWVLYRSCTMAGPEDPHFNIILRIRELMRKDWRCELRHIWREGVMGQYLGAVEGMNEHFTLIGWGWAGA